MAFILPAAFHLNDKQPVNGGDSDRDSAAGAAAERAGPGAAALELAPQLTSMEVGKSYLISGRDRQIKAASRKSSDTSTVEYKITLDYDLVVEEQTGVGNLTIEYDFKKKSELEGVAPQETVGVVGMLTSCAGVQEIASRAGKQLKKRDLTLVAPKAA